MNSNHATERIVVDTPVLLNENLHLRVVELVTIRDLSADRSILDEQLRKDEQM